MAIENHQHQYEISLPLQKVYRIAIVLLPVVCLFYLIPFLVVWFKPFSERFISFFQAVFSRGGFYVIRPYLIWGTISILIGIVMHEMLHGLGWVFFAKRKFRSLSFGIMMPEMAPYAHCKEPIPVNGYRVGILLPGIVLGLLPGVHGIITGSFSWLCYGMLFTWAASGDFIMYWQIRKLRANTMIMDHPEKLGCIVLK